MGNKRIGWIGLGNMGSPMARNLIKAGFPVTVYNRTASKAAPLLAAGAALAVSPADLWQQADVVITMVSDDAALRAVHEGDRGLVAGTGSQDPATASASQEVRSPASTSERKCVIDMSTVSPATSRELAAVLATRGVDYLDAPVSGSVKPAELGQLVIMVGGKYQCYDAVRPIFRTLGKHAFWMGEQGAGNVTKLAINLLLAFHMEGLAEALVFGREKGIRPETLLDVIGETALANGISDGKAANILAGNYQPAFELRHMAKDLRLALGQGMHTPGGVTIHDTYQQAMNAGWGQKDMSAILPYLEGKKP